MALKETTKNMKHLLVQIAEDLEKADAGNKAASQRVRTGTVKLEKVAKLYRKESIQSEKGTKGRAKKPAAKAAKPKASKPAAKTTAKTTAKASKAKAIKAQPKPAAAKAKKTATKARPMSFKRPTAKLPTRRAGAR
ncbi:histone [Parachlamydia sp. AcF125]|uniref:histone H1-like protein HctA n=1 Tax=Parachlamydia sp. AcF125 TaxID=2795736 RepID=UPI001BC9ABC6|nr:histone [Parachlamydia sp. AcF125]MBS4167601.1 Histone H1-like protein HC1 [Parachlamydia sp. AcF125]